MREVPPSKMRRPLLLLLAASFATAGMHWLGSEFRPSGALGFLQELLEPLVLLPYVGGAMFGRSAHDPSSAAYVILLFAEFLLLFWLLSLIKRRVSGT